MMVMTTAHFIVGCLIGSFITLASYRIPLQEKILITRSQCPSCKKPLSALNLIPVLSYLMQRGKCSKCKSPISPRYIIIELIAGLVFAIMSVSHHENHMMQFAKAPTITYCLTMFIIQFEKHTTNNKNVYIAGILSAILTLATRMHCNYITDSGVILALASAVTLPAAIYTLYTLIKSKSKNPSITKNDATQLACASAVMSLSAPSEAIIYINLCIAVIAIVEILKNHSIKRSNELLYAITTIMMIM